MHLMYYMRDGERVYTLKKVKDGRVTKSAHPARYSPDDDEAKYRLLSRQRYALRYAAYDRFWKGTGNTEEDVASGLVTVVNKTFSANEVAGTSN